MNSSKYWLMTLKITKYLPFFQTIKHMCICTFFFTFWTINSLSSLSQFYIEFRITYITFRKLASKDYKLYQIRVIADYTNCLMAAFFNRLIEMSCYKLLRLKRVVRLLFLWIFVLKSKLLAQMFWNYRENAV